MTAIPVFGTARIETVPVGYHFKKSSNETLPFSLLLLLSKHKPKKNTRLVQNGFIWCLIRLALDQINVDLNYNRGGCSIISKARKTDRPDLVKNQDFLDQSILYQRTFGKIAVRGDSSIETSAVCP
jgi:hypothetical protein